MYVCVCIPSHVESLWDHITTITPLITRHVDRNQTMAQWESSVDAAIASGAAHVSVYDLQVRHLFMKGRTDGVCVACSMY